MKKLAFIIYDKLWRNEVYIILSAQNQLPDKNLEKINVGNDDNKDEEITWYFETSNEDFLKKDDVGRWNKKHALPKMC